MTSWPRPDVSASPSGSVPVTVPRSTSRSSPTRRSHARPARRASGASARARGRMEPPVRAGPATAAAVAGPARTGGSIRPLALALAPLARRAGRAWLLLVGLLLLVDLGTVTGTLPLGLALTSGLGQLVIADGYQHPDQ